MKRVMNRLQTKTCTKCNTEFLAKTDKQKYCTSKCRTTHWEELNYDRKKVLVDAWKANNPDKAKDIKLRRYYGITIDQYRQMEKEQNHVCKICESKCKTGRELSVDHCHKTGKVRGLLCGTCNYMLGSALDRVDLLAKGIKYLESMC